MIQPPSSPVSTPSPARTPLSPLRAGVGEITGDVTGSGDDAGGAVAGGVVGGLLALLALAAGGALLLRRRRKAQLVLSTRNNLDDNTPQIVEGSMPASKKARTSIVTLRVHSDRHEEEKPGPPVWAPLPRLSADASTRPRPGESSRDTDLYI